MRIRTAILTVVAVLSMFSFAARCAEVVERDFEFPRDGGAHRGYGIEWWYTSGHLESPGGRSFGFMSAFFKVEKTLVPTHFCMMGLTDEDSGRHYSISKADRTTAGMIENILENMLADDPDHPIAKKLLGYFEKNRDRVVLDNPVDIKTSRMFVFFDESGLAQISKARLDFRERLEWDDIEINLDLVSKKAPLAVGENGVIPMGREGLSYYYSLTRLETTGTVKLDGEEIPVTGLSWLDHQWGNWDGQRDYHGWDWFSVQLDNDIDMNLFSFRAADGSQVNATATILDGEKKFVSGNLEIVNNDSWTNPVTGNTYPIDWTVKVPDLDISLDITPRIPNQEMCLFDNIGLIWEGSTDVKGTVRGRPVSGVGYTELTGYTNKLIDELPVKYAD